MKVLVAGDFCPQSRVARLFEEENYSYVLDEIKDVIEDSDYSIVNLECPVVRGGESPILKCGPNLSCSEKGIAALKWVGFDSVTLANNHILDYGKEGLVHTLQLCEKYGIDKVGAGVNLSEASTVLYKTIKGKIIAVINCCEHEFSIATKDAAGSNPLNPIQQYYDIKNARTKADFILVIIHGGHEHWQLPSIRMVETYRFFIDCGADAVVNHHQHCFSGYEVYKDKPIFYGLGNFCFDDIKVTEGIWTEGYAVCLNFEEANVSFSIHPYNQCNQAARIHLLNKDAFDLRINKLNSIISNKNDLENEVEMYYDGKEDYYSDIFEPIRNRYYLGAKHRKWFPSLISKKRFLMASDFIRCESHRDFLFHYFRKFK